MSYYRTCPNCGANLDPGERCDCQDKKETAPGATNTQSGKVEQKSDQLQCSASSLPESKEESQVLKGSEDSHKAQNMSNNERFNEILNSCKHPRLVFNALVAFPKEESQA